MGIKPPEVKSQWDNNDVQEQAYLLAYNMIRLHEEDEELMAMINSRVKG